MNRTEALTDSYYRRHPVKGRIFLYFALIIAITNNFSL